MQDLSKGLLVAQINEEVAKLKTSRDAIKALVGKKGIKKGYEEVKKNQSPAPNK